MIYDYMSQPKEQRHITEEYVSSPPALIIVDEHGHVFTLATEQPPHPDLMARGEYSFAVNWSPRHGVVITTDTWASRIERRQGKIRAFTRAGWRTWNGRTFL